ncbi:MAG TPA: 23S rRNA (pseudouridine(1915)-N(3))-methyltransferase RlmH [Terriglobales bacterium]|nr:23S rRNA (pseudouridine(1915)-N(3))-methyltransferase RlmH [Terriglobales bacterium]
MKLRIAWIGKTKEASIQALTAEYVKRLARYVPTEWHELRSEAALIELVSSERTRPFVVLLDSRGKHMSSEELAEFVRDHQDRGTQTLLFAIGPADGFGNECQNAASFTLSLGKMTLPHELARVVLLEQIYRAFTIIKGHPYHTGH